MLSKLFSKNGASFVRASNAQVYLAKTSYQSNNHFNQNVFNSSQRSVMGSYSSSRNFSSSASESTSSGSIFDNAEWMKEEEKEVLPSVSSSSEEGIMPFFDSADSLGSFQSIMPKVTENLPTGQSTYGLAEFLSYADMILYESWMAASQYGSMGLCGGLLVTSLASRMVFMPIQIYSQTLGWKMKLLAPDMDEGQAAVKRYQQQGNKDAAKIENQKLKSLRKQHGIRPIFSIFQILQLPMHLVFIGLVNRLSYDFTINPAILTDGILWFKDLSSPDPTGILPVLGGLLTFINIINTSSTGGHKLMRKGKKFLKLLPFVSVPIWMTFPVAFNLYWLVTSGCQGLIQALFRVQRFRRMMGIPQYLPGTKLERANIKGSQIIKDNTKLQKVFTTQQSKNKMLKAQKKA